MLDHVLKKPHVSDCCYKKKGDSNPSYYDWLGAHKTEGERERDVVSATKERKVGEGG